MKLLIDLALAGVKKRGIKQSKYVVVSVLFCFVSCSPASPKEKNLMLLKAGFFTALLDGGNLPVATG